MLLSAQAEGRIALAARLDAASRHLDALDVLARASAEGAVRAKAILGVRLLLGDRAPPLPQEGIRQLTEAAETDGGAAHLLAVICAAGLYREQDWSRALDQLVHAAELGATAARGALAVLSEDEDLAARASAPGAPDTVWAELRTAIDPAGFARIPEGRTLSGDPLVRAYSGFASGRMRDWLVRRAAGRLSRARVYNAFSQREQTHETRSNSAAMFGLLDIDLVQLALQTRIAAASGAPFPHLEPPAILHYAPGEQISEHFDFVDPSTPNYEAHIAQAGLRVVTFLVYLNDGYEGGETEFPHLDVSYKAKAGDAVFFANVTPDGAPDRRTLHAGRPPRGGDKWIVSQFIRSRPSLPMPLDAAPSLFEHPLPA